MLNRPPITIEPLYLRQSDTFVGLIFNHSLDSQAGMPILLSRNADYYCILYQVIP